MHRENERHCLLEIVKNTTSHAHRGNDGRKIVVHQHQCGGFTCHVGTAPAHGNTDVRRLERRGIIDTVTGHCYHLAVGFQRADDTQFLLRHSPCKDAGGLNALF
jgi:hypothetical protein